VAASLREWEPRQFAAFLAWMDGGRDGEPRPVMRCDHNPLSVTSRGAEPAAAGECLRFASVPAQGDFPGGLLCLAELDPRYAQSILGGMRSRGQWTAMSVGGVTHGLGGGHDDLWLAEVSLVRAGDQADPGALVIATGADAAAVWELLAGGPAVE
jgi:hypothetical protein